MKCVNCGDPLGESCVEGGFCSAMCAAAFEHEQRLTDKERMSLHLYTLDDGGYTVVVKLRDETGFQEMTRNYEEYTKALRGIADLCTSVANEMEKTE